MRSSHQPDRRPGSHLGRTNINGCLPMSSSAISSPQSWLFVPGSRPDRFETALNGEADAVIVDLEDAVEAADKEAARMAVAQWISPSHPVLVRINGRATPWFEQDAQLAGLKGVAGIVLPKAECPADIEAVVSIARNKVPVFPLIETACGMWSAMEIARAPGVRQLMFGTLDFIADMGMGNDTEALNPYRAQLALISRVAGLAPPIDGVTPDIHDLQSVAQEAMNGKRHGFGGKLCIHPRQVPVINRCYRPSEHELAWAAGVVEAVSRAGAGAITLDGKMVDRPVLVRAQRLLALANAVRRVT